MSSIVYPKKRMPISVSLGISTKLATTETINDEMFSGNKIRILQEISIGIIRKNSQKGKKQEIKKSSSFS
ncbi:unnamed protein product [marine sediment metagenome]|uniref:Uncharacterized protein n=1 Tax=marine sediment metagenome TaxID=412755 RepID=X1RDQ4_9ZZZZ